MMSFRSIDAAEPASSDFSGFSSAAERDQAQALIDQCAQFKGVGEALAGRKAKLGSGAQIALEPGFVAFPKMALRDLPAGPAGRLGLALMGASVAFSKAPIAPAKPSASAAPAPSPLKPVARAQGGNSGWLDEEEEAMLAPQARHQSAPKAPKRFAEEGEGEDSFAFLVKKLEDEGFGGASSARVRANLALAAERLAKRKM